MQLQLNKINCVLCKATRTLFAQENRKLWSTHFGYKHQLHRYWMVHKYVTWLPNNLQCQTHGRTPTCRSLIGWYCCPGCTVTRRPLFQPKSAKQLTFWKKTKPKKTRVQRVESGHVWSKLNFSCWKCVLLHHLHVKMGVHYFFFFFVKCQHPEL